jgi:hypothetical protein
LLRMISSLVGSSVFRSSSVRPGKKFPRVCFSFFYNVGAWLCSWPVFPVPKNLGNFSFYFEREEDADVLV